MTMTDILNFLVPQDYVWDRWYELFMQPLKHPFFIFAWALTMLFGIQQYVYAGKATKESGKSPYPFYMHTFYFGHDGTWAYIFLITAIKYKTCWWFYLMVLAFIYWTYSEMQCIKSMINDDEERNRTWGAAYPEGISKKEAWKEAWIQIAVFWAVTNLFRIFMGSASLWQWTIITNVLMQVGPVLYWKSFKSRKGTSIALAGWILACSIYTFSPISAYVVAFPEIFHTPLFYVCGVITIIIGIYGVCVVKNLQKEES